MHISLDKMLSIASKSKKYDIVNDVYNAPHLINICRETDWAARVQAFNKHTGELVATKYFLRGDNATVAYDPKGNVLLDYFTRLVNGKRHTIENLKVNGLNDFVSNIRARYNELITPKVSKG